MIKDIVPTTKYLYSLIIHERSNQKSKEWEEQKEERPKHNVSMCFFFFCFRSLTCLSIVHTCVCVLLKRKKNETKIEKKNNIAWEGICLHRVDTVGKRDSKGK